MGLARELQAAAWINSGCLSAASAACPLSSGQLGKTSKTAATPHCPKGPKGTARIPDQDMPFFPEEGLSVPWGSLLFQNSSLETEEDMKWDLKSPFCILKKANMASKKEISWHQICLCSWSNYDNNANFRKLLYRVRDHTAKYVLNCLAHDKYQVHASLQFFLIIVDSVKKISYIMVSELNHRYQKSNRASSGCRRWHNHKA